jgi:GntR family transcriptional regulator/MocR family aminotransferase
LERYRKNCSFYSTTVSRIDQKILEEFIKGGYFERYLNKMRKRYRDKHDYLLELLKPFQKQFKISGENAGLHLLLTETGGKSEQELIATAREQGVIVYGLSENLVEGVQQTIAPTVILGYGGLEEEQLKDGIEALKKAWLL